MDAKEVLKWDAQNKLNEVAEALRKKHFGVVIANSADEVRGIVEEMIPEKATVAVGGSVTLIETGVEDLLENSGKYNWIDRYHQPNFEIIMDKYREGYFADWFVTSTNAVTKNGELVNTDSTGNRVGCISFGPKKVIVIAGVNKIVEDIAEGIDRSFKVAPLNAKRIGHNTPCAETGVCVDCDCKARMCNTTSIVHTCVKWPERITVILVPEVLGY